MSSCRSSMTRGYAKSKLLQCGRIFGNHRDDLAPWDSQVLTALLVSDFQRAMDRGWSKGQNGFTVSHELPGAGDRGLNAVCRLQAALQAVSARP